MNNVSLWFAKDENGDIVTINNSEKLSNKSVYRCPLCGSQVIAKAFGEDSKVSAHFAHLDKSKCAGEHMIHWWFKNKLIEEGQTFKIKTDCIGEYICSEILVESRVETSFGNYIPDLTVKTKCGKTIYFEMNYSNKKNVSNYLDMWIELGNIVVEVDVKDIMSDDRECLGKSIYYKDMIMEKKNYKKPYKSTVYKMEILNSEDENKYDRIKKFDWMLLEIAKYKKDNDNEKLFELLDILKTDFIKDYAFIIGIIRESSCLDIYIDYCSHLNKEYVERLKRNMVQEKLSLNDLDVIYNSDLKEHQVEYRGVKVQLTNKRSIIEYIEKFKNIDKRLEKARRVKEDEAVIEKRYNEFMRILKNQISFTNVLSELDANDVEVVFSPCLNKGMENLYIILSMSYKGSLISKDTIMIKDNMPDKKKYNIITKDLKMLLKKISIPYSYEHDLEEFVSEIIKSYASLELDINLNTPIESPFYELSIYSYTYQKEIIYFIDGIGVRTGISYKVKTQDICKIKNKILEDFESRSVFKKMVLLEQDNRLVENSYINIVKLLKNSSIKDISIEEVIYDGKIENIKVTRGDVCLDLKIKHRSLTIIENQEGEQVEIEDLYDVDIGDIFQYKACELKKHVKNLLMFGYDVNYKRAMDFYLDNTGYFEKIEKQYLTEDKYAYDTVLIGVKNNAFEFEESFMYSYLFYDGSKITKTSQIKTSLGDLIGRDISFKFSKNTREKGFLNLNFIEVQDEMIRLKQESIQERGRIYNSTELGKIKEDYKRNVRILLKPFLNLAKRGISDFFLNIKHTKDTDGRFRPWLIKDFLYELQDVFAQAKFTNVK